MTEDQIDEAFDVKQIFLEEVREAFRKAKRSLSEEQFDYIVYNMQDALSLFSPWMNIEEIE